jgi:release factor glutamine methyltransferase
LSNEALTVAKENATTNGVAERIKFTLSDLLDNVPSPLDVIVSNLPYVSEAEYEALPKDVKDYEPQSALLAGAKGTEIIERLIQQAAKHLKPSGHLFLEGSPMIADAIQQMLSGWQRTEILLDSFGRKRIIYAQR